MNNQKSFSKAPAQESDRTGYAEVAKVRKIDTFAMLINELGEEVSRGWGLSHNTGDSLDSLIGSEPSELSPGDEEKAPSYYLGRLSELVRSMRYLNNHNEHNLDRLRTFVG